MGNTTKSHDVKVGRDTLPTAPESTARPEVRREPPADGWTRDAVYEALRWVVDPELQINVVDLGLVYGVEVAGTKVLVRMTLTTPGCPYGDELIANVRDTLLFMLKGIRQVEVDLVWEPRWGPQMMTEDLRVELGFDVGTQEKER